MTSEADPPAAASSPRPVDCGLHGLCPRCGERTLFRSWIAFADRCRACDLDFAAFNVGDGPAAFLTLIIGTLIVVAGIVLELAAAPPWWVHVLLWVPLTVLGTMASLRLAKGWLIALEYRNAAREGKVQ